MASFSTIIALTMLATAPEAPAIVNGGASSIDLASVMSIRDQSHPEAAERESGRHLQSAAVTASAKLVIPRFRDRHSARDIPVLSICATAACSSSIRPQTMLAPRCAILRI